MTFGDVIRSAYLPPLLLYARTLPRGVGGDANVIWYVDVDTEILYELSVIDFSIVMYNKWWWDADVSMWGIGGTSSVVWSTDFSWAEIYELSSVDLSIIRKASAPTTLPLGCGGDASLIWNICDSGTGERIYELSVTDFSVSRSGSPMSGDPRGIGGKSNVIWMAHQSASEVYEMSVSDFSFIRTSPSPSSAPMGIGGDASTIWHVDYNSKYIYELDSSSVVTLSGTISDEWGNTIRDADITISNGATYTTTTDENGAYSQLVNPDTYDISISKPRSRFHDITESVSVTADTTKNITMPTDRIVGKSGKQNSPGISIPGGMSLGS